MIVTTTLLALVACGTSNIQTGDSGTADSGNTGSDSGTTGNTGNDESPSITSADAYCSYHSTGDAFYQWGLEANVDDPQGRDTIEVNQAVEVYRGGTLQASYGLVCGPANPCIGSFREDTNGILCDSASDYTVKFLITDEDGNTTSKEVAGYQK